MEIMFRYKNERSVCRIVLLLGGNPTKYLSFTSYGNNRVPSFKCN